MHSTRDLYSLIQMISAQYLIQKQWKLDSATAQAVRGQAVQGYNITTIATRSGSRWLVHGSVNEIAKLAGHKPA
jgi:hypothetical protein